MLDKSEKGRIVKRGSNPRIG